MKKLVLSLVGLVVLGGAFWVFTKNTDDQSPTYNTGQSSNVIEEAWIEITEGSAFLKTGGQGVELKNGNTLKRGVSVETGRTGRATVHFPDGSVLRLDKETSITISDIYFKKENNTLIVRVGLTFGRAWSKVVGLSTPESEWEVKTSNTVATVRGTAFGVGFKNGRSWVLGGENKVAVTPIDPITKEKIASAEVIIETDKLIEIGDKEIKEATATTSRDVIGKKIVSITPTFAKDTWIQNVKKDDKALDAAIEEIKKQEKDEKKVKEKLIERTKAEQEKFQPPKKESEGIKKETEDATRKTETETKTDIANEEIEAISRKNPVLLVTTDDKTETEEGTTLKFRAILKDSSEKTVDVTERSLWRVLGSIGKISSPGVFIANLGNDVSEIGVAVGYVVAEIPICSLKNPNSLTMECPNPKFIAQSNLIRVKASGPLTPLDIGGQ